MSRGEIVALGSVNVEFQCGPSGGQSRGETLLGHDFLLLSGGTAANVAYLAHKLGVSARLVAHVGDGVAAGLAR